MLGDLLHGIKNQFKKLKESKFTMFCLIVVLIIVFCFMFLVNKSTVDEFVSENFTQKIDLNSDGNGNIFVKDGIIVSFENIYAKNNYIALQVKTENNTGKDVTIEARIDVLDKEISYTTDSSYYEYLLIGDSMNSQYDVDISIIQNERVVAEGTVHVTQTMENSTLFAEETTIYYTPEMEIYFLGTHDNSLFMIFNNKRDVDSKVEFTNDEGGFSLSVEKGKRKYVYITGVGAVNMGVGTYDIAISDVKVEDIIIEEVDGTE